MLYLADPSNEEIILLRQVKKVDNNLLERIRGQDLRREMNI